MSVEREEKKVSVGRFAPSPTGRMHLGNVFTAYVSWRSVRARGGKWILRIEDLDPCRSRYEYARLIEDDLAWLGLDWDEGGLDDRGDRGPYSQSRRGDIYAEQLENLRGQGLTYGCRCRRADLLASQAPHQSDGRVIYGGRCRPEGFSELRGVVGADGRIGMEGPGMSERGEKKIAPTLPEVGCAERIYVPDVDVEFRDRYCGRQVYNLARDCGDFIVRRSDGVWAYQLAVVVDDALMGVTEVVRGNDLLLSTAQQIYLYDLLGFKRPEFGHLPLVCNEAGERLSKRDASQSMEELRRRYSATGLRNLLDDLADCAESGKRVIVRV